MAEHNPYSYKVRSPHRLILVLFALVVNALLWSAFYSILGLRPERASQLAALAAFLLIALISFVFKKVLEE